MAQCVLVKQCVTLPSKTCWEYPRDSDKRVSMRTELTGRFLAESKYRISNADESPSLAWSLSALMLVST